MRDTLIQICDTNNGWVEEVPAEQFADYLIRNDVVKVVRCKDCKHYIGNYCCRDIKDRTNMFFMKENDYCSYGERKE